jgi:hypothetical protein
MRFTVSVVALTLVAQANVWGGVSAFTPSTRSPAPLSLLSSATQRRSATPLYFTLNRETGKSQLDPSVIDRYNDLPFPSEKVLAEYVWVDAAGNCRSKTRTLPIDKVSD